MADGLQHAGEFKIDMCELITSTGMRIDLKTTVMGLTLFEDISSLTVSGTIVVADAVNMVSHGPILGQEYLYLKIHTPTFTASGGGVIDFSENVFLVHSVAAREKMTNGTQVYSLNFVSQELIKNQRLKVMQSLTASWSDIVTKMLTDTAYLDTKKDMVIEPSAGIKKFVSPNIRPLDVVKLAAKQAVSTFKGQSTYLFYETLKGFNFRTLASMYNVPEQLEYTTFLPGTNITKDGNIDVLKDLQTILSYDIISNNDNIVNYRSGMYGSKLIVHNIIGKTYTTDVYNYHDNFENEHHIVGGVTAELSEFPLASDLYVNEKDQRVSDFYARTFLMPTSKSGGTDAQHNTEVNNNPYMSYDPENWVQLRNSQMIQLENAFNINIEVHGNTLINVGDKVTVNIPYTGAVKGNSKYDRFYQGPFLIKTIRHDFNVLARPAQHRMYMNLVKDSLEEQIFAPDDNYEPSATESGIIEEYDYVN